MNDRNIDYWTQRAIDFAQDMEEAGLSGGEIISTVALLAAVAVHKTDDPLRGYWSLVTLLTGAAEDESRMQATANDH